MKFPLQLTFKVLAFSPQIYVRDADGASVLYVQQRLFKLKESIRVFLDETKSREIFHIDADRVLDISAKYTFTVPETNTVIGGVQRSGMRSLWRAHYKVLDEQGGPLFDIEEENPWIKMLDGLLANVPVVSAFTGMFLNPAYRAQRHNTKEPVMRLVKRRAFLEGRFTIEKENVVLDEKQQLQLVLALFMVTLLERRRG